MQKAPIPRHTYTLLGKTPDLTLDYLNQALFFCKLIELIFSTLSNIIKAILKQKFHKHQTHALIKEIKTK